MSRDLEDFVAETRDVIRRLNVLLNDPQPGLATWCLMFGSAMDELTAFWACPQAALRESPEDAG